MTLEEAHNAYSDFHKDAYGFRPRGDVSHWTLDDFAAEFDRLAEVCERNNLFEAEAEKQAIAEFEKTIQKTIATGAKDRATAIRWLVGDESEGSIEFENGLPYGYLKKAV
jgi:hypothetical protein